MSAPPTQVFDAAEYWLIGATESADDDPLRLRPIARSRTEPYRYGLVYENDAGEELLVPEQAEFIREQMRAGRFLQLDCPVALKPHHWLLQLEPGRPPEYIAASDVPTRLTEAANRALRKCAQAVLDGDTARAREHIGYASVVQPDDPFATLVRIALWRADLSESQLRWELEPLDDFTREQVEQRFRAIRDLPELQPLMRAVARDPLSENYNLASPCDDDAGDDTGVRGLTDRESRYSRLEAGLTKYFAEPTRRNYRRKPMSPRLIDRAA